MKEPEFRDVLGYEGIYSITREGRIWSHPRTITRRGHENRAGGLWLQWMKHADGCWYVTLTAERRQRKAFVHRLVADAWLPPRTAADRYVCHLDEDRSNPNADNLVWRTVKECSRHSWGQGKSKPGAHVQALALANSLKKRVLTMAQAERIRARKAAGERQADLAREYQVSPATLSLIIKNRRYALHLKEALCSSHSPTL